jgi:hypothetical protein
MRALLLGLGLLTATPAFAGTLAGVTLPDTASVGGSQLVLNGMGLREKYMLDIYVGGLYLPAKTTDANKAINDDVPKRIVMHMTYDLSKDKLGDVMRDSLSKSGYPEASEHAGTLASWMDDVEEGDQIVLDYVPGKGCSVSVKGAVKGTLQGTAVMKGLWSVYLGDNPPTKALKSGLLGL